MIHCLVTLNHGISKRGEFNHQSGGTYHNALIKFKITSWWFQPLWKVLVKMGIFPKSGWTYIFFHHHPEPEIMFGKFPLLAPHLIFPWRLAVFVQRPIDSSQWLPTFSYLTWRHWNTSACLSVCLNNLGIIIPKDRGRNITNVWKHHLENHAQQNANLIPSHFTGCVFKGLPWALFNTWHTNGSVKPSLFPTQTFSACHFFLALFKGSYVFLPHAYSSIKMLIYVTNIIRKKTHPNLWYFNKKLQFRTKSI